MSRFRIYQIDHYDPKIAGQNLRRQVTLIVILDLMFILIITILILLIHRTLALVIVIFPPLLIFNTYCFHKLSSKLKKTKAIGEIEFTRTCIKRKIGDSLMEFDLKTVKKIELQKHYPSVYTSGPIYDNFTYILRINFFNSPSESLVVSNLPMDSKQNIGIVKTMTSLKKLIEPEITIEI